MKVFCVILALLFTISLKSNGKIRNGYEKLIEQVLQELNYFDALKAGEIHHLDGSKTWDSFDAFQRKTVDKKIKELHATIQYYLLTEMLINKFQNVCPGIYSEIDKLENFESQKTDVYIKVMPPDHKLREISGATLLSRDPENVHECISEYGENSVSVLVCPTRQGIKVLAHELGHVRFIVPNLNKYIEYCSIRYRQENLKNVVFNHQASDLGSKTVIAYEIKFKTAYKKHLEEGNIAYNPKQFLKEIQEAESWDILFNELLAKNNFIQ